MLTDESATLTSARTFFELATRLWEISRVSLQNVEVLNERIRFIQIRGRSKFPLRMELFINSLRNSRNHYSETDLSFESTSWILPLPEKIGRRGTRNGKGLGNLGRDLEKNRGAPKNFETVLGAAGP